MSRLLFPILKFGATACVEEEGLFNGEEGRGLIVIDAVVSTADSLQYVYISHGGEWSEPDEIFREAIFDIVDTRLVTLTDNLGRGDTFDVSPNGRIYLFSPRFSVMARGGAVYKYPPIMLLSDARLYAEDDGVELSNGLGGGGDDRGYWGEINFASRAPYSYALSSVSREVHDYYAALERQITSDGGVYQTALATPRTNFVGDNVQGLFIAADTYEFRGPITFACRLLMFFYWEAAYIRTVGNSIWHSIWHNLIQAPINFKNACIMRHVSQSVPAALSLLFLAAACSFSQMSGTNVRHKGTYCGIVNVDDNVKFFFSMMR